MIADEHFLVASFPSVSIPSISGITISRIMTFGDVSAIASSSCFPLVAALTSYPVISATSFKKFTTVGSSSVIINVGLCIVSIRYVQS